MGTRGRVSGASLAVAAIGPEGIVSVRRPDPPPDLSDEAADEWRAIVNRLPAEWFPRETWPLLADYCKHIIASRRVAEMISALEEEMAREAQDPEVSRAAVILSAAKTMDRLLKMQDRESRALASLATKMRISQQSTYDKSKAKPRQTQKPWEA